MKLIIQIPCFNESETLPLVLSELPKELPGVDEIEVLIIDDGSTDGTADVARSLGVDHVVSYPNNRGLAHAFMTGIDAALAAGADIIVNTDADNQYPGDQIHKLVAPVVEGRADIVLGERPIEDIDDFSPLKKKLQRLGSTVVRKLSGTDVRDAPTGFRAFSREAALRMKVFGRFSYTVETLIQAGWEGTPIASVDITTNPSTRPSRLARSMPVFIWRQLTTMVRSFALYKPFRFFVLLGIPFLVLSLILIVRWLGIQLFTDDTASRVPSLVAAAVSMMIGAQLWILAFVADLLSANRRLLLELRLANRRRDLAPSRLPRTDPAGSDTAPDASDIPADVHPVTDSGTDDTV